jgi:sodium/hydrogen antiporter
MDFLLNIAVFMWLGAVCPWEKFFSQAVIPSHRLILLGILVLLFRRLPIIIAVRRQLPQIRHFRHALIMGFFGPIGISAIFYLYVTLDFLQRIQSEDSSRTDCSSLAEVTLIAVWFLVVSSVVSKPYIIAVLAALITNQVVHGLAIPLGNLALLSPRVFNSIRRLGTDKDISAQQNDRASTDPERQPLLAESVA